MGAREWEVLENGGGGGYGMEALGKGSAREQGV
jgi:hypothetical protein